MPPESQPLLRQQNTSDPRHPHEPEIPPTIDAEGRCLICRLIVERDRARKDADEEMALTRHLDAKYEGFVAHVRAVIENAKTADAAAIRHQLVGLLPEVQPLDPDLRERLLANPNMKHLVDHHDGLVRRSWAEFGYGEADDAA